MSIRPIRPPYLRGYLEVIDHMIAVYDMQPEDAEVLRRHIDELISLVDSRDQQYQKALAQLDALRAKGAA